MGLVAGSGSEREAERWELNYNLQHRQAPWIVLCMTGGAFQREFEIRP